MALTPGSVDETPGYLRRLIYGAPGVGKTTFWGDAAENGDLACFDYENSTEVFRGTPNGGKIKVFNDRASISDYEQVLAFIKKKNPEYSTYVFDTLSSMYDNYLMAHMRKKSGADRHIALFADFRKVVNVLKEVFYELINVEKDVILVAHEKVLRDPETNKVLEIRPQLPPSAEDAVEKLVNEVFYIETKPKLNGPDDRIVWVDSHGKILAKNRRSYLTEAKYVNPTWKQLTR